MVGEILFRWPRCGSTPSHD